VGDHGGADRNALRRIGTVGVDGAGDIAPQSPGEGRGSPDPSQRPEVVAVERGGPGAEPNRAPPGNWLVPLADRQVVEWLGTAGGDRKRG
jgi:hypothetical protein